MRGYLKEVDDSPLRNGQRGVTCLLALRTLRAMVAAWPDCPSGARRLRLARYDYREVGAYFVTICTKDRSELFGEIHDGWMIPNEAGWVLSRIWARTCNRGQMPEPYEFVVMPNHVHGIVWLPDSRGARASRWHEPVVVPDPVHRAYHRCSFLESMDDSPLRASGPARGSLSSLIGAFKGQSTRYIREVGVTQGAAWQRGFYDRIVRGDEELERVRQYILDNPAKWMNDPNHPSIRRTVATRPART